MRSSDQLDRLFPPVTPFARHRIDTGDGHVLYVEECGNPDGIPVIFLHGGPGSGVSSMHRRMFNPDRYRAVLFDQRGSGQSRPFASIAFIFGGYVSSRTARPRALLSLITLHPASYFS